MTALLAYCISLLSRRLHSGPVREYAEAIQPFIKHKTLTYQDFQGRNVLIIGDVHGCYDEAMELIEAVKTKSSKSFVTIFVGDMVNKGPKSIEMLDFIMKTKDVHCIRGNHEQAVLRKALEIRNGKYVDSPRWPNPWFRNISAKQFEFLRNLPYSLSIPMLQAIVVHGGLNPSVPLWRQSDHDLLHMRGLVWVKDHFHGQVLKATENHKGEMWAKCWQGPEHVYFGHDAIKLLQLEQHCTGLDTGCLYGKKLTGVLLEVPENLSGPVNHSALQREFFSVNAKKAYVPVD